MYIISINVTPQQEFVDKRQHLRPLTLRQLTMSMTAYDTPAHTVGYTELGPYLSGSLGRNQHSIISQPFVIRITQQQQSTWTHKRT